MTYIKSVFVGLLATFIAIIVWFFGVVVLVIQPASKEAASTSSGAMGGAVGWDPISVAKMTHLGTICLLVFMAGFIWESRRARRLAGMSFADQNHQTKRS